MSNVNASDNSTEMEDAAEAESRGKSSPTSPLLPDESKTAKIPEFPLTLLHTQAKCDVYPDVRNVIQVLSELLIINLLLMVSHFQVDLMIPFDHRLSTE